MPLFVPLVVAVILVIGGCSKKEESQPVAPAPPAMKSENAKQSATPAPSLPAPNVPKGAEPQSPAPGQANDHSSPDFKGGGVPDKKK